MKLALIARADHRGLGVESLAFYQHMNPHKTLVVDMGPRTPYEQHFDLYPDGRRALWDERGLLPHDDLEWLVDGSDAVLTFETSYDYSLMERAREAGCKTVLRGNWEFMRFATTPELPRPDLFVSPSTWHFADWPDPKVILATPIDRERFPFTLRTEAKTFLHVVGHPAAYDRAGTRLLIKALPYVKERIHLIVRTQRTASGLTPRGYKRHVTVEMRRGDIEDNRDLYAGADVLIAPRRYGGQCLVPGSLISTPSGRVPIENLKPGDAVLDDKGPTSVTAVGSRRVDELVTVRVRGVTLTSSTNHIHGVADSKDGKIEETKAEHVAPGQWMLVVRPKDRGISRTVELGPKPKVKGLRNWPTQVVMDEGWARIIGLYLSEGCSALYSRPGRNRPGPSIRWSFGPTDEAMARGLMALLAERGVHTDIKNQLSSGSYGTSPCWIVRCRSLWVYELFTRLGLGAGAWTKRAPDFDSALVPNLIGGWLDGDGSVDNGTVSGFSRSTAMIQDFWRLLAKVGILGSIGKEGQLLRVGRPWIEEVAAWTTRLAITKEFVRPPNPRDWVPHHSGWMARVQAVEHSLESSDVISIETESHWYVANDLLTHNSLPCNEAMSLGLAVLALDREPERNMLPPEALVPSFRQATLNGQGGPVGIHGCAPRELARKIDELAREPSLVEKLSRESDRRASLLSWEVMKPRWAATLASKVPVNPQMASGVG